MNEPEDFLTSLEGRTFMSAEEKYEAVVDYARNCETESDWRGRRIDELSAQVAAAEQRAREEMAKRLRIERAAERHRDHAAEMSQALTEANRAAERMAVERDKVTNDLQRIAHELGIGAKPYSGHEAMEKDILPRIQYLRRMENGTQLAYQITLEAMLEEASKTLREWADMDDDGSPRLMVIAAEAKRTLKAMREIGGVN